MRTTSRRWQTIAPHARGILCLPVSSSSFSHTKDTSGVGTGGNTHRFLNHEKSHFTVTGGNAGNDSDTLSNSGTGLRISGPCRSRQHIGRVLRGERTAYSFHSLDGRLDRGVSELDSVSHRNIDDERSAIRSSGCSDNLVRNGRGIHAHERDCVAVSLTGPDDIAHRIISAAVDGVRNLDTQPEYGVPNLNDSRIVRKLLSGHRLDALSHDRADGNGAASVRGQLGVHDERRNGAVGSEREHRLADNRIESDSNIHSLCDWDDSGRKVGTLGYGQYDWYANIHLPRSAGSAHAK